MAAALQTREAAGAGMEVSNELGPGFREAAYQEALEIQLEERKIPFAAQLPIRISCKGRRLARDRVETHGLDARIYSRSFASIRG